MAERLDLRRIEVVLDEQTVGAIEDVAPHRLEATVLCGVERGDVALRGEQLRPGGDVSMCGVHEHHVGRERPQRGAVDGAVAKRGLLGRKRDK